MTHTMIKLLVLLACAGHLALWHCDWIITCLAGGRFDFRCLKDNEKLAAVMGETPLKRPMRSMVLGTFAMMAAFPGYLAVCEWMRQFSGICALLMALGSVLFFLPGVAHHVMYSAGQWSGFTSAWERRRRRGRRSWSFSGKLPPQCMSVISVC